MTDLYWCIPVHITYMMREIIPTSTVITIKFFAYSKMHVDIRMNPSLGWVKEMLRKGFKLNSTWARSKMDHLKGWKWRVRLKVNDLEQSGCWELTQRKPFLVWSTVFANGPTTCSDFIHRSIYFLKVGDGHLGGKFWEFIVRENQNGSYVSWIKL